jgi:hypothetical protein
MAGAGIRQLEDHLDAGSIAADTAIDYEAYGTLIGRRIRIIREPRVSTRISG